MANKEKITLTKEDVGEISLTEPAAGDAFEGYSPIPGLEHLGAAIVDKDGQPSGSPANYQALRGRPDSLVNKKPVNPVSVADIEGSLAADLPAPEGEESEDR